MFPPWPCQAVHEPISDGIAHHGHHDGNDGGRLLSGTRGRRIRGNDDVDPDLDEFLRQCRKLLCTARTDLNDDACAVHITELAQPLPEDLKHYRRVDGFEDGPGRKETDSRNLLLLRAQLERPGGSRAKTHPDDGASSHLPSLAG
jgi:hypothetical protein